MFPAGSASSCGVSEQDGEEWSLPYKNQVGLGWGGGMGSEAGGGVGVARVFGVVTNRRVQEPCGFREFGGTRKVGWKMDLLLDCWWGCAFDVFLEDRQSGDSKRLSLSES